MILGIDPGIANLGWAVVRTEGDGYKLAASGWIKTKAEENMADRLGYIYKELGEIIKKYEVRAVAMEGIYFARNAKSALKVAEVIGVIRLRGKNSGMEVFEYTPLQIKMSLVGYGQASKDQVEAMVKNFIGFVKSGHIADAAGAGLTHLFTNQSLRG